jgi:hypothetical protein
MHLLQFIARSADINIWGSREVNRDNEEGACTLTIGCKILQLVYTGSICRGLKLCGCTINCCAGFSYMLRNALASLAWGIYVNLLGSVSRLCCTLAMCDCGPHGDLGGVTMR